MDIAPQFSPIPQSDEETALISSVTSALQEIVAARDVDRVDSLVHDELLRATNHANVRWYVLFSAGLTCGQCGATNKARELLLRSHVEADHPGQRFAAIEAIIGEYRRDSLYRDGLTFLDKQLLNDVQQDDVRTYFLVERARLLSALKLPEEAADIVRQLARKGQISGKAAAESLEEIAVDCAVQNNTRMYASLMKWISENLESAAKSLRFRGNLAHALQVDGDLEESLRVRRAIVKEFPDDRRHLEHLFEIANLLFELKRFDEAKEVYEKILELPAGTENESTLVKLAAKNLSAVELRLAAPEPSPIATSTDRPRLPRLIAINLVLSCIAICWLIYRKRRSIVQRNN